MPPLKLQCVNFAGYEGLSDAHGISAAVVVPAGARLVATSGHVGVDSSGKLAATLKEEIAIAFSCVEKSILAVDPSLSREEAWRSVYQITTYHAGGLSDEMFSAMAEVASTTLQTHKPAWTAVGVDALAYGHFEIAVFAALQ